MNEKFDNSIKPIEPLVPIKSSQRITTIERKLFLFPLKMLKDAFDEKRPSLNTYQKIPQNSNGKKGKVQKVNKKMDRSRKNRRWTQVDDNLLQTLALNKKLTWKQIGDHMGRTGESCRVHYTKKLKKK